MIIRTSKWNIRLDKDRSKTKNKNLSNYEEKMLIIDTFEW